MGPPVFEVFDFDIFLIQVVIDFYKTSFGYLDPEPDLLWLEGEERKSEIEHANEDG